MKRRWTKKPAHNTPFYTQYYANELLEQLYGHEHGKCFNSHRTICCCCCFDCGESHSRWRKRVDDSIFKNSRDSLFCARFLCELFCLRPVNFIPFKLIIWRTIRTHAFHFMLRHSYIAFKQLAVDSFFSFFRWTKHLWFLHF